MGYMLCAEAFFISLLPHSQLCAALCAPYAISQPMAACHSFELVLCSSDMQDGCGSANETATANVEAIEVSKRLQ